MPNPTRKTLWPCYAITSLVIALIFLWTITGVFRGGEVNPRFFSFHILIPTVSFLAGSA